MEFHQRLGQDGPARRFLKIEHRRLLRGPNRHEIIQGLNVETYSVRTDGNAAQVVERVKEVMILVNEQDQTKPWPSEDEWLNLLPAWFVDCCKPGGTTEEDERRYERLRAMSEEEERAHGYTEQGEVSDWIGWFSPDEREWLWWDAKVKDSNRFVVGLDRLTDHYPIFPGGFVWLLTVCGAVDVCTAAPSEETVLFPLLAEDS